MSKHRDLKRECVTASVRTADGHGHLARVLRTELAGESFHVDLSFSGGLPTLDDGEEVVISFSGNRIAGRPTTRSTYVPNAKALPRGCGRFHVDLCTRGGLSGLIERRGSERVTMSSAPTVDLRLSGSKLDAVWRGNMLDLSSGGLQLDFQANADPGLQPGRRVEIEFELPGSPELFQFGALLQYRRTGGGRARYGMEFERIPSDAYRTLEGRLFGVLIGLVCDSAA